MVLSGQHTLAALRELRKEKLRAEREVPKVLDVVHADVLRVTVPVARRRAIAGAYQHRQHQVAAVPLSRLVHWLAGKHYTEMGGVGRLKSAAEMCGVDRNLDDVCPRATSLGAGGGHGVWDTGGKGPCPCVSGTCG